MRTFKLPYGKKHLEIKIPDEQAIAEMVSEMHYYKSKLSQEDLVKEALSSPIGSPKLYQMAEGKEKAVKKVIYAVAGDCNLAHIVGKNFLSSLCKITAVPSDIVITTIWRISIGSKYLLSCKRHDGCRSYDEKRWSNCNDR